MMHVQEFAERILLGKTLSEKLLRPDTLDDTPTKSIGQLPKLPNRPPELALDLWHKSKRIPFPSIKQLDQEKPRGLLLHFFANHELLALELMALALLKFPEAPAEFRKGLVHTIFEEQNHMRLYQKRMRAYGVAFGEIPVNDFFWTCISGMHSLKEFVASMSLTLEQANLDYALYYRDIFKKIEDEETSKILERVYYEEIGHVKHGLKWTRLWKDPQESDWEAHKNALTFPLSPARAKGTIFSKEARRLAGFSDSYIAQLELYSKSKGRSPSVYWFNPACENQIAHGKAKYTPSKLVQQLTSDFSSLPVFFCAQDDVVLVPHGPSAPFLGLLKQAGFSIPEFIEVPSSGSIDALNAHEISQRKIGGLCPWGWSPDCDTVFAPLKNNLVPNAPVDSLPEWQEDLSSAFSKAWSVSILQGLLQSIPLQEHWNCNSTIVGRVCTTVDAIFKTQIVFQKKGFQRLVAKAIYSASGQNMVHFSTEAELTKKRNWLENILQKQGAVVVEPWLNKVMDFSLHLTVSTTGTVSILGATQFFTDHRGQFQGSIVGRMDAGLESELLKFLHFHPYRSHPKPMSIFLEQVGQFVGKSLFDLGYCGPVGVDLMVYKNFQAEGEPFGIKPIVEINPRHSMGRLALMLAKHLKHRRLGVWIILTVQTLSKAGYETLPDFAQTVKTRFPIKMTDDHKIDQGGLLTTDPATAKNFSSLLLVGYSYEQCQDMAQTLRLPITF